MFLIWNLFLERVRQVGEWERDFINLSQSKKYEQSRKERLNLQRIKRLSEIKA
jgi:hypothetical protein